MTRSTVDFRVNGRLETVRSVPDRSLLSVLREDLGLTGTKYGCGEGECGSCTVLLDDRAVKSCQVRLSEVGSRKVTTVEGLQENGALNPVQRAFVEVGAFQCGFCTPGMVVRATALLRADPSPTPDAIREALEGNVCRCGGYAGILRAVQRAVELEQLPGHGR